MSYEAFAKVLKERLKKFRARVPRIRQLRSHGVNAILLTQAAGSPMITYGVEASGYSDSMLEQARRTTATAVAALGGGENYEAVLHVADAGGSTVDPAFAAHSLPMKMWSLALTQR